MAWFPTANNMKVLINKESIKNYHMRVADAGLVRLHQETFRNNVRYEAWFGHFYFPITSLFMVRNRMCGYSFS